MIDPLAALGFAEGADLQQYLESLDGARSERRRGLEQEVSRLRRKIAARFSHHSLLGKNPRVRALFEAIDAIGCTRLPVLIEGEAGAGKQQLARAIHQASVHGARAAFVAVDCAVQPERALPRRIDRVQRGTLYLGEIAMLPVALQAELVQWLGSNGDGDTRLIAGSSKSLRRLVRQGSVLEELWDRLRVVRLEVPPLRQRPEDIRLLAEHFVSTQARGRRPVPTITAAAMRRLLNYRWPGNIRELEAVIQHACRVMQGGMIEETDLPAALAGRAEPATYKVSLDRPLPQLLHETLAVIERQYLRKALRRVHGNVVRAARLCGLSRRSVTAKIAAYGINRLAFKEA